MATLAQREHLAVAYGGRATHGTVYTTVPTATTAGTEVTGGTFARKALTWAAGSVDGSVTATATFDIPAGVTVRGGGLHTALTGGEYVDGGAVTEQAFPTGGTYTLTFTYTQNQNT